MEAVDRGEMRVRSDLKPIMGRGPRSQEENEIGSIDETGLNQSE